ncbi:hypothetical protein MKX03_034090 [Papaver bracteatum]|nr:hypothetical protein MKX03_034090 [Papaver bracteatum]
MRGGGGSEIIFVPEDELRCNVRCNDWRCKNWRIHGKGTCQHHYLKGLERRRREKKKELSGQNCLDLVAVKADDEEEEGGLKRNKGFIKGNREIVKQSEDKLKVYSLTEKRSRRRTDFSGFVTVKSEKKEDESKRNKGFMEGDGEIVKQSQEKLKVYSLTGKRSRRGTDLSGFVTVKSEEENREIVKQSEEKLNVYRRRKELSGFVTVKSEKEENEMKSNKGLMKGDREIVKLNNCSLPEKRSRKRKDFSGFVSDYVDEEEEEEDEKKSKKK